MTMARRNELAQERGFANYYEERQFRQETKEERAAAAAQLGVNPNRGDPTRLTTYYENVLIPQFTSGGDVTGRMRHDLMAYLIKYEGMDTEEALEAMREIYGNSPGSE